MIFRYIILTFLLFASQAILAQQPVSIHLTEKDGLPDIEFYDLLEDNKGFIWLAADKGLYRYDGKHYKLFTHPKKRGRSLFKLTLDAKGRVWCNNLSGQFFYAEGENLTLFKEFEDINTLAEFNIYNNHLIIEKEKKSETVTVNIKTKKTVAKQSGTRVLFLPDINQNTAGFYYNLNNIIHFTNNATFKNAKPIHSKSIANKADRSLTKFFEYNNSFYYFIQKEADSKIELKQLHDNTITSIVLPNVLNHLFVTHTYQIQGKLWILTNKGIFVGAINNNRFIIENHYFEGLYITDVIIDKNKNFWVSTLKNGIYVMPNPALIKIALPKNNGVTALEKSADGNLYLATSDYNVYRYSKLENQLTKLNVEFKNNVYNICHNHLSDEVLMVAGTKSVSYNTTKKTFADKSLFVAKSINFINKDNYLVSLPHMLSIYNSKTDTLSALREFRSYNSVLNSKKNKAYCNFIDGFGVVDLQSKKYKKITQNNQPIYTSRIAITNDDIVWVAAEGKGVYGFDNDTIRYNLTTQKGLASSIINVIKPDKNTLWLATDKGLQNYNYTTGNITTITREDGIDSYNINAIEILENDVFFASNIGLYQFNKSKILKDKVTLKPYFTTIAIQEKDTVLKTKYNLKQTESEIKIGFNVNGFHSKDFVSYQYQLKGFNENWVTVENGLDFVKFNTLPAGTFSFNVRAKNKYQNQYTKPIRIDLKVSLPFYKTWWFYVLLTALIFLLVWRFFFIKTKQLKAKQKDALMKAKINQQLVFSQLENLRSQMNPHFIFNALNSIQDYIILNEKKLARAYLVKFSRLIRIYLEHSQQNEVSLDEEVKALSLYLELEKERFDDDFNFEVSVDESLNKVNTFVPSLFIQPYVENALKHGLLHKKEHKKLCLNFRKDELKNQLICDIIDNGIGRKASEKIKSQRVYNHKPFATSANQKRIDLLNRNQTNKVALKITDVLNENQDIVGTKVTIVLNLED